MTTIHLYYLSSLFFNNAVTEPGRIIALFIMKRPRVDESETESTEGSVNFYGPLAAFHFILIYVQNISS